MGNVETKLENIVELLVQSRKDCQKFDKGVASAATRVRKNAQAVVKELKNLRTLIAETRSARKATKTAA